jgi:integrase
VATIEKRLSRGRAVYRVKVRLRGHPPADGTFERITDAKRWAAETETRIREGRWFQQVEARRHTLADLIDRYDREYLASARMRSKAQRRQHLAWWRIELGATSLADLTPARITAARARLLETTVARTKTKLTPSTANRYMASLAHCLMLGVREYEWLSDSPMRKIASQREPRGRVRYLTAEERASLLRECLAHSQTLHDLVLLAISTGARKGELLDLRWSDVNLVRGTLTFHETKNDERRTIPLVGRALRALRERRGQLATAHENERVFKGRLKRDAPMQAHSIFARAATRAGLKDFRFHDLRHEAASQLAMSGATTAEIAEVLGHKTLAMVKRYSHLTEGHTRAVVERMTERIFGDEEEL